MITCARCRLVPLHRTTVTTSVGPNVGEHVSVVAMQIVDTVFVRARRLYGERDDHVDPAVARVLVVPNSVRGQQKAIFHCSQEETRGSCTTCRHSRLRPLSRFTRSSVGVTVRKKKTRNVYTDYNRIVTTVTVALAVPQIVSPE